MNLPDSVRQYIPVLIVGVLALGLWQVFFAHDDPELQPVSIVDPTPAAPFEPIEVLNFTLITPGPLRAGEEVGLQNGLCNRGDVAHTVTVQALGIVQSNIDPVFAAQVVVVEDRIFPLAAGECRAEAPMRGRLPAEVTPGAWSIFATLQVTGPAGQIQRITLQTETFEVLP
jgi:hypothetical protein